MSDAVRIRDATDDSDIATARRLFLAYAGSLDVDLCFQGFDDEMARFPGEYQPPGGALLLAEVSGTAAGVVALRPAPDGYAEMKRLYLGDAARGMGLGARMAEAVVARARDLGYRGVVLDTLPSMESAQRIYRRMGFETYVPPADGGHPDLIYFRLTF
ncbi:MAG: GNAT family N-acetyltransferase [Minwuia sp.]|uniref:GNAT family N-acetyltransferase n=1 Tax=Minwuia sp. TaxID=2493630 RepID=UPI003A89EAB8